MKLLFLMPFILFGVTVNATNYYISASGNDNNNGTSSSAPWQSINKLNSVSGSLKPGDNIFFNSGDVFYGSITVASSGSTTSPITFGAYGSGAKPIITGFKAVTLWTNKGGNIWESTNAVSTLPDLKTVVINGQSTPMGRYPNGDGSYPYLPNYYIFQSVTGTGSGASSITSSFLNATNWTGADVVVRINQWTLDKETITSQSGTTINYNGQSSGLVANWGFFIQNDIRTLDQQNEWYYNPSSKKIDVYSTSMPTSIQVSTIDTLFKLSSNVPTVASVNIDNLKFQGANTNAIWISGNLTFSVTNCDISYSGFEGLVLYGGGILSGIISDNSFYGNGNSSIFSTGNVSNLKITYNNIVASSIISIVEPNDYVGSAIQISAPKSLVQYNTIDSCGYIGIGFRGDSLEVRNNFVNHVSILKGDDAGIYTGFANEHGKVIDGNIILNSIGNPRGSRSNDHFTFGIYSDDLGTDIKITNNSIANCRTGGIYLHNSNNLFIRNNTIYNCGATNTELMWANGGISMDANASFAGNVHDNTLVDNIVFAANQYQNAINYYAESGSNGEVGNFGTIDSNYYVKINSSSTAIKSQQNGINGNMDLSQWQSQTGKDKNSKISPKTITVITDTRFEYNPTKQPKVITLDASYIDVKGNVYNGIITLAPYTSAVLIKNGVITNPPLIANAGPDQMITLPANFVNLTGSGSDSSGTIISYKWIKISGPSGYVMANDTSATMALKNLVRGIYKFQLTVADNNGASGVDTAVVTVNAPPRANAGQDQTITLPTSSVTLSGSATDSDGVVVSYLWTKISGPSAGIIVNPASVATPVTSLAVGIYQFELSVTDNNGATAVDTVMVTVNPAPNQAPVANAGSSQNLTLPLDSAMLSGSGVDRDGTVVSYLWTKISGPSNCIIAYSLSPATTVSGLVQGNYTFQITVTDNQGATGTDIVQIIVNAAHNIPPTANAGPDQTITLPINSVVLNGSGNDSDGVVVNYSWTKISGPSNYNVQNPLAPIANITGLLQGTYQFQLQVTDNNGALATDIVQVTVNAAANIPPVANAGQSKSITLPANSIILSGSATDSDGTVVSYNWSKISGPSNYHIASRTSAVSNVTNLVAGIYQFQLQVTDNGGAVGTSIVQITVNPAGNIPPIAKVGSNRSITLPNNTTTLSGSGSDSDGVVVSYLWTKLSGPSSYNIVNATSPVTDVSGLTQGIYQFELQVTDNGGATGNAIIQVMVNAAANMPPSADAGPNQSVTLPVNSVTLSGRGSDLDGTVSSYLWTKLSGPANYNISNSTTPVTDINGLVLGVYQFQLQVTDNDGATGTSIVQVTVNAAANIPPTSNAGGDTSIVLPANSVNLTGTGNDVDGTVVSYLWTKISGPSTFNISASSKSAIFVSGLVQGIYVFELEVTDDSGATAVDSVQVTVAPALNIPPIANAGPDQTITLPVNTTTLSGSGTDSDGTVTVYLWTKISGPSNCIIEHSNAAVTALTGLVQGNYQFELKVTDNKGAATSDTMLITVNLAGNISPVANAGLDQTITLPTNSISLSGSGIDSDGSVVAYLWTKISGPASYSIANPASAGTSVIGLVQGIYQFQLQVTDNDGAIGTSTIKVTVNAAPNIPPVADAGSDQTITLPVNNVTLSGSGTDADGTIVSYLWTEISGPSNYTIISTNTPVTNATGLVSGIYKFQLKVTDNNGAFARSIVKITVNNPPNQPPVANAGAYQAITLPTNSVTLSGIGTDADGRVVSYQWIKISGPSNYNIANSTSSATKVSGLIAGSYQFQLKVTDNDGAIGIAITQVTVNAALNMAPVANAGLGQTITLPTNSISLLGSGIDSDGSVIAYLWTKISGPAVYSIADSASAGTSVIGLVQGIYQFQLQVTDNDGAIGTSTIKVTVNATPNIPPVANAGSDQTITLPANNVTLSGSGTDADGTIVSYLWTEISGPSAYSIVNLTSASTSVSNLVKGIYQFQLTVTDNNEATSTDMVQVNVNSAPNQPPVAKAGPNLTITLPVNNVTLSGSGTDADGTVVSYLWTKISGPSKYNIANPAVPVTNITGLAQGVYQFELRVTDNNGATATSIAQVTVNAAPNQPPVANAGINQTITLPINSVILSGTGTDPDGTVASYTWSQVSGPSVFNIVNINFATTNVTGLIQGVYQFELKVTDNSGAKGRDTVQVSVNAAINLPPTANAGPDKIITLPVNTISLSGSGYDADGTIAGYTWTKLGGPAAYNFVNANSPVTDVWGLTQGIYLFELKITDNNGAIGRDTVKITVNAVNISPVAKAGPDQTISLPDNSVTLSGSGTDADGTITSYSWKQIAGPAAATIVSSNMPLTVIDSLIGGNYEFELTVTDNYGAIGRDTVTISVAEPRLNLNPQSNDLKVYPNPVIASTTLEINRIQTNPGMGIVITDARGQTIYKKESVSTQNHILEQLDLSNLAKGIYFITTYFSNNQKQTVKISKM